MNSYESVGEKTSGKRVASGTLVVALFYVLTLLFLFIMIIAKNPSSWRGYIKTNAAQTLMLCVSVLLLYCIIYYYNIFEKREFFSSPRNLSLLYTVLLLNIIVCYLIGAYFSVYARPVTLLSFLLVFLFDRRQAILTNFVFALIMFSIDVYFTGFAAMDYASEVYFSIIVTFVCSPFAVFMAAKVHTRGKLLLSGVFVAIPTAVVAILLRVFAAYHDVIMLISAVGFAALGSLLAAVLALSFLPVLEYSFNKLTVFRLRELTSATAPLLDRLQKEAPGTFNHCLVVAHLAEACAVRIGVDAELARAAAYYHDVGKLKQPDCFTENQHGYNVHDELMPELSADIIRSHTRDGYDLLVSEHLPPIIADIAAQHHGTLPIKYFYDKAVRLSGGGDVDIKMFSYQGPKPLTKIAAIIMIADASEAACRTAPDRTPAVIERIVRAIIEERMDLEQFTDCNITMSELTMIKQTLVEALSGVHHHRVEYPAIRFNRDRSVTAQEAATTKDGK